MSEQSRDTLKSYFETGDIPNEEQFGDTIDSFISRTEDGITFDRAEEETIAVGINSEVPKTSLTVTASKIGKAIELRPNPSNPVKDTAVWHQMVTAVITRAAIGHTPTNTQAGSAVTGYLLARETTTGLVAALHVDRNGKVGVGRLNPTAQLHIAGAVSNSTVGAKIENATTSSIWEIGHLSDLSNDLRNGSLVLKNAKSNATEEKESLVLTRAGRMGLGGATNPDTTLQVHSNLSDPNSKTALRPNTGVVVVGPLLSNITLDDTSIQSRQAAIVAPSSVFDVTAKPLNLQPLGGDLVVHSNDDSFETVVKVATNGNLGLGVETPTSRLHVNGAIQLMESDPATPVVGMVRWNGNDIEVFKAVGWKSLTIGDGNWEPTLDANDDPIPGEIYFTSQPTDSLRVGIGTNAPAHVLHIKDDKTETVNDHTTALIEAISTSTGDGDRIGLEIKTGNSWTSVSGAHDVGLYVSSASGVPAKQNTAAALLNGNVVIGGTIDGSFTGTSGNNVLVVKQGVSPTSKIGSTNTGGIQVYAFPRATSTTTSVSTFQVMNGDGTVLKLFRNAPLETPVMTPVGTSYDSTTKTVIDNMRLRINQLETTLKNLGVLPPVAPALNELQVPILPAT
ncbi:MAG: hypothetical protein ACRCYO_03920 [Bacteroidia bacterium]